MGYVVVKLKANMYTVVGILKTPSVYLQQVLAIWATIKEFSIIRMEVSNICVYNCLTAVCTLTWNLCYKNATFGYKTECSFLL
jgi:hypothetical protein